MGRRVFDARKRTNYGRRLPSALACASGREVTTGAADLETMRKFLCNRWTKLSAALVGLLVIAMLAAAWHYRIWNWHDLQVYRMMGRECHPVWKDLHWGRLHPGQDVEEVIA